MRNTTHPYNNNGSYDNKSNNSKITNDKCNNNNRDKINIGID